MQWNKRNQHIKLILILVAIFIAAFFLIFSHYLTINLKQEARAKMNVWAEAMRALNQADENTDLRLVLNVINNNTSIPVIVLDDRGEVIQHRNLHLHWANEADSVQHLLKRKEQMLRDGYRIRMAFDKAEHDAEPSVSSQKEEGRGMDILYEDSNTLKSLEFFPYIQLALLTIFILIIVFTLLSLKRAEQNRVWVGLTKETAHQLGTPISSLMAWNEILKDSYPDDPILPELGKDIARLELIAERFSKVGSQPELKEENLNEILWHVVDYISKRTSDKVKISCSLPRTKVMVNICAPLFEWVVENLCKNAVDAMEGKGKINIIAHELTGLVVIEISDTGKGISPKHFKTVFAPGFTTKKRGWGLGLSLAKRIIEKYHDGRIYVKSSELNKGTTFRIELKD